MIPDLYFQITVLDVLARLKLSSVDWGPMRTPGDGW